MIQIDMPMPTNCLDCPACNEYLMCAIPVNGRKWGENEVREYGQCRPEWCPLKEQEPIEPISQIDRDEDYIFLCSNCKGEIFGSDILHDNYCTTCGRLVNWHDRY